MFLLLRNLRHFRGVNLAVVLGMAVATAVLTGAMMVGDSVRASLTRLAEQRLGAVDDALIATRFVDRSLVTRLSSDSALIGRYQLVAGVIVRGAAANDRTNLRTAEVQIGAIDPSATGWPTADPGRVSINGLLANDLEARTGDSLTFTAPSGIDTPREATLARRSRNDTVGSLRSDVSSIVREQGFASLFNPAGGQRPSRNAWVNLADLQEAIDEPNRVNTVLAHHLAGASNDSATRALNEALARDLSLADVGITQRPALNGAEIGIGSRSTYLSPALVSAAERVAARQHVPLQEISVNLMNTVACLEGGTGDVLHYVVAAGISTLQGETLAPGEAAVNRWAADQLHAHVGDRIQIDYYQRTSSGDLANASSLHPSGQLTFRIARILPMEGIGADKSLPPDYKGLTDADSVADWDPPEGLPIDKSLVTKADEEYWRTYRAAPKLFLSFQAAQGLWGGVYGDVTGLRIPANQSVEFLQALEHEVTAAQLGLVFRPIRAEQIAAANGGTDFAQYFVSFSFFLIASAVLLVAMLFRLNIEQRARQLGLLGAVGFAPGRLRRLALGEGMLLAVFGAAVGLLGAVGYTWLIMAGLRTWWIGAVGTTAMHLYVNPLTLAIGLLASLFVAFFAILWGAWRVGRAAPAALLAGTWDLAERSTRKGGLFRLLGLLGAVGALGIIAAGITRNMPADVAFMTGGGVLLCAALLWLSGVLRPHAHRAIQFIGAASLFRLGVRNTARHTARSVLAVGLIAFAVFILVVVAVMRQSGPPDTRDRKSGAGGYQLILQAGIPILADLNTIQGRRILGFRDPDAPVYRSAHFTLMRSWAGQDISCLNLTRPSQPTILSAPKEMIDRNAFTAGGMISRTDNFWTLLDSDQGRDIPVIADDQTAQYILQLPIGGGLTITDQLGQTRRLKLVATVSNSIFQGQLLMGEKNFRKLFPGQAGWSAALIDAPGSDAAPLAKALASELDDYSVSVDTTSARLEMYQNVANTYLATFQTLGSLGLLLGTLGLAVVLVRTVLERKPELALLASLGFRPRDRVALVLSENSALLLIGLLVGLLCAVVAVLPAVWSSQRSMNLTSLGWTLLAVMALGISSSAAAVALSGVHISPADLRRE